MKNTPENIIPASAICILSSEGKILMLEKNGVWGLPGGKLAKDETYLDGAIRELCEETGIIVEGPWLTNWRFELDDYAGKVYSVMTYGLMMVYYPEVTISTEHSDYIWVTPQTALSTLPLMGPMTKSFLEELACFN